jgi:acetyl-CoA carboxylase biotin carboxyl carrier protein
MIDLEFVERLIRALDQSTLDSLEVEQEGTRVRLSKSPAAVQVGNSGSAVASTLPPIPGAPGASPPSPVAAENAGTSQPALELGGETAQDNLLRVTSPMVGTFYRAPAPDAPPYVEVGGRVGKGTVLCIIEAMKLMNELESEVEGTIAKVLVENAQPVEYGQVLFLIDPS